MACMHNLMSHEKPKEERAQGLVSPDLTELLCCELQVLSVLLVSEKQWGGPWIQALGLLGGG